MKRVIFVSLWIAVIALAILWGRRTISTSSRSAPDVLTFVDDVEPILRARCTACHHPYGSAPFSLEDYADVTRRGAQIVEVVESRYMPPWLPSPSRFRFANDRRMPDKELATLRQWFATGMFPGDMSTRSPKRISKSNWKLDEPDLVLTVDTPFKLPAEGPEVFWNFVLPANVATSKLVRTVEIQPGNFRAVHHVIGLVDRTGSARRQAATSSLAGASREGALRGFEGMDFGNAEIPSGQSMLWSPGKVPAPGRDGIAWQMDPTTDIVLQLHMFPTGKEELIKPKIGFYFTDVRPSLHPISIMLEAASIDIPAGTKSYEVRDQIELPVDVKLLSLYPHAHYLATTMQCVATLTDNSQQVLLQIDDWDFNWQDEYEFEEPVELPAGTVIEMRYTYDNSADNVRNPNHPPQRVVLGNRSTDEMGSLLLQMLVASKTDHSKLDESRWQQKLQMTPLHAAANQNLGNIYEARKEFQAALECYRRVLQVAPRDPMAYDNVGSVLSAMGEHAVAESIFQRAIQLDPAFASAHSNWGVSLMRQGRIPEAVEKLTQSLEIWPAFPEALLNLGEAELLRGNTVKAVEQFRLAVKHAPNYALAHFNLGTVLMNTHQYEEAAECFHAAIQLENQFAEAYNNLGIVLYHQNKLEEAAKQFRRSIDLDASYESPRQNLKILEQQR